MNHDGCIRLLFGGQTIASRILPVDCGLAFRRIKKWKLCPAKATHFYLLEFMPGLLMQCSIPFAE